MANQPPARHGLGTNPLTYGDSPASGPAPHTAGHHRHDVLNKLDPSVDSTRDRAPIPPPGAATNGPHTSRLANKLDPRVDTAAYESSTRASAAGYTSGGGMMGGGTAQPPMMHGGMTGGGGGAPEGTYGPHTSRAANAIDPRVDSDRDGRGAGSGARYGQHHQGVGGYGQQHHEAGGYGQEHHGASGYGQHQRAGEYGGVGNDGQYGNSQSTQGQYHHQEGYGAAPMRSSLPGPAPNTAGPHRSDLLNKLDPTVDSKAGMAREGGQLRKGI